MSGFRVYTDILTGMLARSGTYNVKSRVVDDDGEVYADWEWSFKLAKEW
jgi:Rho GDP-dissociation inhibitor